MPHVNDTAKLTGSWFCPGLPASGEEGVGGEVVVSNRAGEQLVGRFSVLTPDGVAATQDFTVEPWSRNTIDVVGAGDRAVRECRRRTRRWGRPRRAAGAPPGRRFGGPVLQRHVRHVVPRRRVHRRRQRGVAHPVEPVRRRGDRPVDVRHRVGRVVTVGVPRLPDPAALGEGDPARRDSVPATSRSSPSRSPRRAGGSCSGGRSTTSAAGGSATRSRSPPRRRGTSSGSPTASRATASPRRTRSTTRPMPTSRSTPCSSVCRSRRTSAGSRRSPFRHAGWSCSTRPTSSSPERCRTGVMPSSSRRWPTPSIVVERVLTRPADDSVATTVVVGAPPREDGFVATQWHLGIGPADADDRPRSWSTTSTTSREPSRSRPSARAARRAIEGLSDIPIGPGAVITIDLAAPDALEP